MVIVLLSGDILQTKDSKTKKDLCIEELVNTEGKFVAALQMIREVSWREFCYQNSVSLRLTVFLGTLALLGLALNDPVNATQFTQQSWWFIDKVVSFFPVNGRFRRSIKPNIKGKNSLEK